jgi:hypothetical protein|tara:strand:- start:4882 stop:5220 length:339 start_codon:yes stop_codon:yes gene_type:complete
MNITDWVTRNLSKGTIKEVVQHGCVSGVVSELIYYSDTAAFHDEHQDEIWDMLNQYSTDNDEDPIMHIVSNMNANITSMMQLKNQLTWWAVEEVCYELNNEMNEEYKGKIND